MATIQLLFDDIKHLVDDIERSLSHLCEAIAQSHLQAVYWDRDGHKHQLHAPAKVLEHLQLLSYTAIKKDKQEEQGSITPPHGAIGVTIDIQALVDDVNTAKTAFKAYHANYVNSHENKDIARSLIRDAVMAAGIDTPNIKAVDRQIVYMPHPVTHMDFHIQVHNRSLSRPMSDLINELERLGEKFQSQHSSIGHYLDLCRQLPPTTRVCYKNQEPATNIECRITHLDNEQRTQTSVYAANPIIFNQVSGMTPIFYGINEGRERTGAGRKLKAQSRPIDDNLLPHWYFYEEQIPTAVKQNKSGRVKNPHSSTAFAGLWLGIKQRKNGKVAFVQIGIHGVSSSYSINRHGLQKAWELASKQYAELTGRPLNDLLAVQPRESQVTDLLAWVNNQV